MGNDLNNPLREPRVTTSVLPTVPDSRLSQADKIIVIREKTGHKPWTLSRLGQPIKSPQI